MDADWEAIGLPLPGTDQSVYTLNFDSLGNLIVGGSFTAVRDIKAHGLAKWDGSRWTNFDTSSQSHWDFVTAVSVDSIGNIYASGSWFDGSQYESQQRMPYTAKWDGRSWSKIASTGFSHMVFDKKGILYVGGEFDAVESVPAKNVAKWDGKVWSPMGVGFDRAVHELVFDKDGTLYAGGNFFTSGSTPLNGVAKWDGTKWLPIGLGFQGARVFALTFDSAGALYAGGDFFISKTEQLRRVARWDGTQWTPLGRGLDGIPNQLKFSPKGTLLACASMLSSTDTSTYNLYEWNGTSWKATDSAPGYSGAVTVIEFDSLGVLYAGGSIRSFHGQAVMNLARGLPDHWDALGKGFDSPVTSSILDTTGALVVGGAFRTIAGEPCGPVARWNGTDWFCMGKGLPDGTTTRVLAIDTAGTIFAAGDGNASTGEDDFFARWSGTEWHVIERPSSAAFRQLVADRSGNLYAGGSFSQLGQAAVSNVARWDGREWHALGEGVNGFVRGMALDSSGRLFVLGDFDSAGGQAIANLAMWDGTRWSGVYGTTDTLTEIYMPNTLAFDLQGNLYVSGEYFDIGDKYIEMLAKWDGNTWTEIGANYQGVAHRIAFDSAGRMYTIGRFQTRPQTKTLYTFLRLEGEKLASVGSQFDSMGIDDGYSSLINLGDGTFVVGGSFHRAGGRFSPYISRVRTQTAQSIAFDLDSSSRYGDPPQALHAVASSGLPVTFASSNRRIASTIKDTLRITGAGTAAVVAIQRGNDSIAPSRVRRHLVVAPRRVLVVAKNASKPMGAIDPILAHEDSGLLAGDSLTGHLSRDSGENAGTYVIRQGDLTGAPNYTIDFRVGSFAIEASTKVTRKTSQVKPSHQLDAIVPTPVVTADRTRMRIGMLDFDRTGCSDKCSYQPIDILVPDAGDLLVTVYDLLGTSVFSWRRSFAPGDLVDFPTTDDGRKKIPLAWTCGPHKASPQPRASTSGESNSASSTEATRK